jgi:hypothetical protein
VISRKAIRSSVMLVDSERSVPTQSQPDPEPTLLDGDRLEGIQEHGLADPAQSGQDEVLQDDVLHQQPLELLGLLLPAGQVRRHVAGTWAERIAERRVRHQSSPQSK